MRKLVYLSLIVVLCLVSCSAPVFNPFQFTSNPFLVKTVISDEVIASSDTVSFTVTTDNHFDRDNSSWFNENYYAFLENKMKSGNGYPFAITLGDLTDTGVFVENALSFAEKVKSLTTKKFFTACVGNHDRHTQSFKWDSGDEMFTSAGCYYYGTTSDGKPLLAIYKMDNSYDCITDQQFEYLEEALKKETAVYRMIIIHENVTTGSSLNPTLVIFGLSSSEANRLYRIMSENGVGLILSGHNHCGNIEYHLSDTLGELNLAAYHRKNGTILDMESEGWWYDLTLSVSDGSVTITGYKAEKSEAAKTYSFRLPENR